MKRILLIPSKIEGVIDVRKLDYFIINDAQYLQQIQSTLVTNKKNANDYKYCQFEEKETIPFFIKIKDKLGDGMQEFEVEKVAFSEIQGEEDYIKSLIEERFLFPIKQKLQNIIYQANYLMTIEKLGEKVEDDKYIDLGVEKEKFDKEISDFDYKKYLNEVV